MSRRSIKKGLLWLVPLLVVAAMVSVQMKRSPWTVPDSSPHSFPALQTIALEIGPNNMARLAQRRAEALKVGILLEDDSSWVKAALKEDGQAWRVKVRLKGDWTDHLEGERWSLRVRVRDGGAWRRVREFSLQSPGRRGYLSEWLFHRALGGEGVLSPRYDFVFLRLNGRDLGVYAVEEHFSKELLEGQRHREGPILKWDEAGMWDARAEALRDSSFPYLGIPLQEAASILPFKPQRTLRDSTLRREFRIAAQLMAQYRQGSAPPSELFHLDLFARQYALTDLFQAYHSLIWHNRRYYYNPVTSKLEPIAFDAFSGPENDRYIDSPLWGYRADGYHFTGSYHDLVSDIFFRDDGFVRSYYGHLLRYTDPAFLDSLFTRLQPDVEKREDFLRRETGSYRLDREELRANAARIRACLHDSLLAGRIVAKVEAKSPEAWLLMLRNLNPLPVEVGIQGLERQTLQLLPPGNEADTACGAFFWIREGMKAVYRLPGTGAFRSLQLTAEGAGIPP